MPVQVTVVNNAPAEVVITISEAKEERKEHRPNITKPPETEITEGKYKGKTFGEAMQSRLEVFKLARKPKKQAEKSQPY